VLRTHEQPEITVPNSPAHLTEWTLEQIAEGTLPEVEAGAARKHLDRCARCTAELDAFRTLVAALSELPRFAPPPTFADAVMARVRIAPAPDPIYTRVVALLPRTGRGWGMLVAAAVAPALPIIALIAWIINQPLVGTGAIWQWGSGQAVAGAQAAFAAVVQWSAAIGLLGAAESAYQSVIAVSPVTLGIAAVALAVAIPLSAWSLVRLVRTPMGKVTYAN
jgi:anti-sigma factor RsiW